MCTADPTQERRHTLPQLASYIGRYRRRHQRPRVRIISTIQTYMITMYQFYIHTSSIPFSWHDNLQHTKETLIYVNLHISQSELVLINIFNAHTKA